MKIRMTNSLEDHDTGFLKKLYTEMVLIRRFEERASELRNAGHIPGFLHSYIGQEAVAVGACTALGRNGFITTTHRGLGHILAWGGEPKRIYAELYARLDGYNKAKGGPLHLANIESGIIGANGIVGAGLPIAAGAALAIKRANQMGTAGDPRFAGGVAVSFFGDGASNEGSFHETLNLASLWALPVIFICENNLYGEFTAQDKHQTVKDIASRASSYNMTGVIADGNDVLDVYRVTSSAAANARNGLGPTLIECKTYRHQGHYEGDMAAYRPKDEVEFWMRKDPIKNFRLRLEEVGVLDPGDADAIEESIEQTLVEAAEYASQSPRPEGVDALEHVYVETYDGKALQ